MIRAVGIALLTVVAAWCQLTAAAGREPRLKDVLSRLDTYLTSYETELASLVAEEHYEQWIRRGNGPATTRRTLISDFGFLRLPGRPEWLGLRDTFVVDGQPVPDHQARLDRLLSEGSPDLPSVARRIVEENTRYNLGMVARTINVPMLALDLLGPRNHDRLTLRKRGEDQLEGRAAWTVTFSEREHPTLVKTPDGHNRPAHGTVWTDPTNGAVLRTDLEFDAAGQDSPATTITVLYRSEATVGLLVPYEMREIYRMETNTNAAEEIDGVARYTNFRRFGTNARVIPR